MLVHPKRSWDTALLITRSSSYSPIYFITKLLCALIIFLSIGIHYQEIIKRIEIKHDGKSRSEDPLCHLLPHLHQLSNTRNLHVLIGFEREKWTNHQRLPLLPEHRPTAGQRYRLWRYSWCTVWCTKFAGYNISLPSELRTSHCFDFYFKMYQILEVDKFDDR